MDLLLSEWVATTTTTGRTVEDDAGRATTMAPALRNCSARVRTNCIHRVDRNQFRFWTGTLGASQSSQGIMALVVMLIVLCLLVLYCCWGTCCKMIRRWRRSANVSYRGSTDSSVGIGSHCSVLALPYRGVAYDVPDSARRYGGRTASRLMPVFGRAKEAPGRSGHVPPPPPYDALFGNPPTYSSVCLPALEENEAVQTNTPLVQHSTADSAGPSTPASPSSSPSSPGLPRSASVPCSLGGSAPFQQTPPVVRHSEN